MRTARLVPLCLLIVVAPTLASGGRKPAGPTSQNARTNRGADPPRSPKPAKAAKPKFELKDGDRVVFLGNTLIERAQKCGYWETMLTARYPNRKIIFRNLGWDGDTVWAESRGLFDTPAKGYARLLAHVGRIKPTVIFLGYGNNEAFAGKPGLPRFIKQYNKLLDDLKKVSAKGVRFVLLSPYLLEKQPAPLPDPSETNQKISLYSAAIRHIAENRR
ncbi:MAG: SGNH/GDSL hydrolase family protein, partial [Planctomycetaceae bacterium]